MVSVINGLFPALTAPTMLFQQEAPRNFISYKELKIFHILLEKRVFIIFLLS